LQRWLSNRRDSGVGKLNKIPETASYSLAALLTESRNDGYQGAGMAFKLFLYINSSEHNTI